MSEQNEIKKGIFERIKTGKPSPHPLPEMPHFSWPGDALENFIALLTGFDGRAVKFKKREDALKWLGAQPEMDPSRWKIYSSASGVEGNVTEADIAELRNAANINICVTEGVLGVGEMGAIWVTDESLKHAACALLPPTLFILLDGGRIFPGLTDAYKNMNAAATQYGSFFTGPSATADIEAVHITGAQGPLAMIVLIYNCDDAPDTPEIIANPNADTSIWAQAILNGKPG